MEELDDDEMLEEGGDEEKDEGVGSGGSWSGEVERLEEIGEKEKKLVLTVH